MKLPFETRFKSLIKMPFVVRFRSATEAEARGALDRKIGDNVARLIHERATNIPQVSQMAGIPEFLLRSYIEGTRKLPSSELLTIAKVLGVSARELYANMDEE